MHVEESSGDGRTFGARPRDRRTADCRSHRLAF